jgi:hypothetical protein
MLFAVCKKNYLVPFALADVSWRGATMLAMNWVWTPGTLTKRGFRRDREATAFGLPAHDPGKAGRGCRKKVSRGLFRSPQVVGLIVIEGGLAIPGSAFSVGPLWDRQRDERRRPVWWAKMSL